MAEVYASIIIKRLKTINDIPQCIRGDVKEVLIKRGYTNLAESD